MQERGDGGVPRASRLEEMGGPFIKFGEYERGDSSAIVHHNTNEIEGNLAGRRQRDGILRGRLQGGEKLPVQFGRSRVPLDIVRGGVYYAEGAIDLYGGLYLGVRPIGREQAEAVNILPHIRLAFAARGATKLDKFTSTVRDSRGNISGVIEDIPDEAIIGYESKEILPEATHIFNETVFVHNVLKSRTFKELLSVIELLSADYLTARQEKLYGHETKIKNLGRVINEYLEYLNNLSDSDLLEITERLNRLGAKGAPSEVAVVLRELKRIHPELSHKVIDLLKEKTAVASRRKEIKIAEAKMSFDQAVYRAHMMVDLAGVVGSQGKDYWHMIGRDDLAESALGLLMKLLGGQEERLDIVTSSGIEGQQSSGRLKRHYTETVTNIKALSQIDYMLGEKARTLCNDMLAGQAVDTHQLSKFYQRILSTDDWHRVEKDLEILNKASTDDKRVDDGLFSRLAEVNITLGSRARELWQAKAQAAESKARQEAEEMAAERKGFVTGLAAREKNLTQKEEERRKAEEEQRVENEKNQKRLVVLSEKWKSLSNASAVLQVENPSDYGVALEDWEKLKGLIIALDSQGQRFIRSGSADSDIETIKRAEDAIKGMISLNPILGNRARELWDGLVNERFGIEVVTITDILRSCENLAELRKELKNMMLAGAVTFVDDKKEFSIEDVLLAMDLIEEKQQMIKANEGGVEGNEKRPNTTNLKLRREIEKNRSRLPDFMADFYPRYQE